MRHGYSQKNTVCKTPFILLFTCSPCYQVLRNLISPLCFGASSHLTLLESFQVSIQTGGVVCDPSCCDFFTPKNMVPRWNMRDKKHHSLKQKKISIYLSIHSLVASDIFQNPPKIRKVYKVGTRFGNNLLKTKGSIHHPDAPCTFTIFTFIWLKFLVYQCTWIFQSHGVAMGYLQLRLWMKPN